MNFDNYSSVEIDSRKCIKNSIFVCIRNKYSSNYSFINNAINNGATLIICDYKYKVICNVKIHYVYNISKILTNLLNLFYPINNLKIIGITGTDGKTTTASMIQNYMNQNNNCGYIGTNGIKYNNIFINSINTTPDIITIRKHLYNMDNDFVNFCVIECSSEGILYNRLISLEFDTLIYTNLSHEHLNTHKSMNNYFKTKLSLIKQLNRDGSVYYNADDKYFKEIKYSTAISYGIKYGDFKAFDIELYNNYIKFNYILNDINVVTTSFFGLYNVYNLLATILVLNKYLLLSKTNLNTQINITGRFEQLNINNKQAIIDFAHTPNALENLLSNIKSIIKKDIVLVFGAAGEKDKSKRYKLGKIACKYCTDIIITSEDPKNELITNIFYDICSKIKKEYYLVLFRKDAIKLATSLLTPNKILVIVGKGKEDYEQIYNYKFKYNDYNYTKMLFNS